MCPTQTQTDLDRSNGFNTLDTTGLLASHHPLLHGSHTRYPFPPGFQPEIAPGRGKRDGRNEQAVTSRCRRDGELSGSVRTVMVAEQASSGQRMRTSTSLPLVAHRNDGRRPRRRYQSIATTTAPTMRMNQPIVGLLRQHTCINRAVTRRFENRGDPRRLPPCGGTGTPRYTARCGVGAPGHRATRRWPSFVIRTTRPRPN